MSKINGKWINKDTDNLIHSGDNLAVKFSDADAPDSNKVFSSERVDTISGTLSTEIDSDISTHASSADHDGRYYTEDELNAGQLDNQYYTETELNAGQLDNRYYTETELNAGQLDDRYYTESEMTTISGDILTAAAADVDSDISTHNSDTTSVHGITDTSDLGLKSGNVNQFNDITSTGANIEDAVTKKHDESHTITSHSDVTDATGAQLEELTGSGETSLHKHDGMYYTETELDAGQLDNRYFTESEITTISGDLSTEIDGDISTHAASADHDGRYYTETELNEGQLDNRYYTETEVDTISGSLNDKISAVGGIDETEYITIDGTDISNKYTDLAHTPYAATEVMLDIIGGTAQVYTIDYVVSGTQLGWNGLGLDGVLEADDIMRVSYTYNA